MLRRKMGKSELEVFPIGLGAMVLSDSYGQPDEQQSINTLHAALEQGVNFIDTADVYGGGHNEMLLNKAFHDRWNKVVLATKCGLQRDPSSKSITGVNGRPEYIKQCCDNSLKRLGRNVIDLYYLHRKDPAVPIEETVGAMAQLAREGKVRYIGLSEVSGDTLKKAFKEYPITALQSEYSLWCRDIETEALAEARKLGVAIVPFCPLGRGFLTGKIQSTDEFEEGDFRKHIPRLQDKNFYNNLELVKEIEKFAGNKGCKTSQLALAWLLQQGEDVFPIPGTSKINHLLENIKAIDIQLTSMEMDRLSEIMKNVTGLRYPESTMKMIDHRKTPNDSI